MVSIVLELPVDVWSDVACPWCWVGKAKLAAALEGFPHRDRVRVTWRSFELDPSAPGQVDRGVSYAARLACKYRTSEAGAEAMIARMTRTAAEDGLEMRFDRIAPGNTFDAHRLIHLAAARGRQDAMKERLLSAYLREGARIGDPETLARLAADIGLDAEEARAVLSSDRFAAEVRQDEADAAALGITAVPFFVLGRRFAAPGAQPSETLRLLLDRAWAELAPIDGPDSGPTCGPDGCA